MADRDTYEESEEVCRDFMRKGCTRGRSCKYRHPRDVERMQEFCRDYQNTFCSRINCMFIHGSREDEEYFNETGRLPESTKKRSSPERDRNPQDKDIPLCKDFLGGQCRRGMKCKYRHRSIGDIEYEDRKRNVVSLNESWVKSSRESPRETSPFDEYSHDLARRRIASEFSHLSSRQSRFDDYTSSYSDYQRSRSIREYEDENIKLLRKIEELRKQVDDLTATNEALLEQNARLRAIKNDVSAVLLAESHLVRSTSAITPAQVHLTAATAGVVPYPARIAAAAAPTATANPATQVITAELQGLPVSIASAGGIATASLPSVMTPRVPALSSVPPSVVVTSSLMTYSLPTLCNVSNMSNVATVTVPNVATVNVPTSNRLGP